MTKIRSALFALVVAGSATVAATAGAQATAPGNGQRIERSQADSAKWKGRAARGEDRREKRGMRGERGPGRSALRGVKPTDAQKAQIKAIHEKYQSQFKSIHESMKPAMDEAKAARQRGDTAGVRAAFAKTEGTRQQAQALRSQESAEIRAILTPEQQKTFDANVAQMKARGDQARKGHGKHDAR
ncbi:MAG: Spy/CpxP family protein refolding chaperone [Gemmatimonadaceae bacterium]